MPDGGIVTTCTDITRASKPPKRSSAPTRRSKRRVRERTKELTRLNAELARAKADADDANISKTRFLAAASHDILQPLNAARLYVTQPGRAAGRGEDARLVGNVDASLEAVEEILGALLDISRLDTGVMKPELDQLPHRRRCASSRSNSRRWRGRRASISSSCVFADGAFRPPPAAPAAAEPRLQRRQIHAAGRVLVGCRRRGGQLRIDVYDTGVGIPKSKQREIFLEFHRLDQGAKVARGLGLGLSIVERIARVLGHNVEVVRASGAARASRSRLPLSNAVAVAAGARRVRVDPASSSAPPRFASTTNRRFSTAWRRCSAAGAAR